MNVQKVTEFIAARAHLLSKAAGRISPKARLALRKPALVIYILRTSYLAHIGLGLLLPFLLLIAPGLVDFVTSAAFPPETSTKLLGILKTQQENPLKGTTDIVIMTSLWILSVGAVLLLVWFNIPRAIAGADRRSRRLMTEADATAHTDLAKSRTLYYRALSISLDPELESALNARLNESVPNSPPKSSSSATLIDSSEDTIISGKTAPDSNQSNPERNASPLQSGPDQRYELGSPLGKGAMGEVYRARDNVLDREVALKQLSVILAGDDEFVSRFRREAKALAQLSHPNIVQVYDLIEDGCRLWMVLEFVDGGDLASWLRKHGHLSFGPAVDVALPVAEGLAYAHGRGIVHRDLKPANILLTGYLKPKISDFGIAKLTRANDLTQEGAVLGSPPYMSPEQCSGGQIDKRTDIYALGIVLYELLTGKVPFEGDTASVLARQIVEQPPPLSQLQSDIPEILEGLVLRLLAKNPDDRPADMNEVIAQLSTLKDELILEK
jgi:hypothetical protein